MKSFSEKCIFLLQNWNVVEKLQVSIQSLENEIKNVLTNMSEEVQEKNWWNSEIELTDSDRYFYFANKNWNKYIQIGIEHFQTKNLLGSSDHKSCYCFLWVTGPQRDNIISGLEKILIKDKYFSEYYCSKPSYILKKYFKKYTEEDYEDFIKDDSFVEYVEFLEKVYLTIQSYEIPSDS